MVETAGEDRGWQAANDGDSMWLMNVDPKGANNGPNSKMGRQRAKANNEPNFKRGRQWAKADNESNFKRADNGLGLTMSQT
jgi:hypothetical protein